MHKYKSFLSPMIESFVSFRQASERWNDADALNIRLFDCHCAKMFPLETELKQEMVDSWCRRRDTELLSNSHRGRIYVVFNFINYLRERNLTEVNAPSIPTKMPRTYIPHAFTDKELINFFKACDSLPSTPRKRSVILRKLNIPVFFRLLYSSGIRTIEARLLRVNDVNLENGILNISKSKGSPVPFHMLL